MIQSVGTPYGGSPIARLASLGEFLGVGCGANDDLTVNGAERWQRMIPSRVQAQVFFYATQVSWHTRSYAFKLLYSLYTSVCVCMYMSHYICTMHIMEHIGNRPEVMQNSLSLTKVCTLSNAASIA